MIAEYVGQSSSIWIFRGALKSLEELIIINCPSLLDYTVLGRLLALKNVEIRSGRMDYVKLPSRWPGSLCELRVVGSTNQIGDLPSQFAGTLDLTSVTGLTTLDNLRSCTQIDEIRIRLSAIYKIKDLMPLCNYKNL